MSRWTAIAGMLALAVLAQQPMPNYAPPGFQDEQLIYSVPPVYPKLARLARIEGTVELAALIDETGRVERLKLISGHPLLVKAAMDAVKQWRYRPATWNGRPAAVRATISVSFSLGTRRPRRIDIDPSLRYYVWQRHIWQSKRSIVNGKKAAPSCSSCRSWRLGRATATKSAS